MQYNKFRVSDKANRTLNGKTYASRKEMLYRSALNVMSRAADVKKRVICIEEQVPFKLEIGTNIICKYILDFRVTYGDGRMDHIDVKGYKKGTAYEIFRIKKNLMRALLDITVIEI